jgi:hypothetical protein
MRRFRPILVIFFLGLAPACSPVKGYIGPDRPDTEVSTVGLSYDSQRVEVNSAAMNGIKFTSTGIKVLPGEQRFTLEITVKDPPDHCYAYPEMNRYSYEKCLEKDDAYCDCFQYLEVRQKCYRQVRDGSCDGKVTTRAGAGYELAVTKYGTSADLYVTEVGSARKVGGGDCAVYGQRTETEEEYLGSGRDTANRYGIYRCY